MKLRYLLILLICFFAFEVNRVVGTFGNGAPPITDLLEVHNIGWNLAHGRGYRFDWDDPQWRACIEQSSHGEDVSFMLARRGSHPTMFRPPLLPLLVAGLIEVFPQHSFTAWRTMDCAFFALGACLLCDIAYAGGSWLALATVVILLASEPLLRIFVPGCWTEGLAFDLLVALLWVMIHSKRFRSGRYAGFIGLLIAFLCLDRAQFVLMILPLCMMAAIARSESISMRAKLAGISLGVCLLIQSPWWIRNVAVAKEFIPLGTQGGFNLPDEYSETALIEPTWTGFGMGLAWTPPQVKEADIPLPAGYTEQSFEQLCPGNRRQQALMAAVFCTSLQQEIAVNDCGTQAARVWVIANAAKVPGLMLTKAIALASFFHPLVFTGAVLGLLGFTALPAARRSLLFAMGIAGFYVLSVALTHVVLARFLIPVLPVVYLCIATGVAGAGRVIVQLIRRLHRRRVRT